MEDKMKVLLCSKMLLSLCGNRIEKITFLTTFGFIIFPLSIGPLLELNLS